MYDDGLTIWVGDLDAWINVDFSGENEAERNAELLEEDLKEIGNISLFAQKSISSRTLLSKGIEPDAWRWSLHEAEIALGGIAIQGQIERRFVRKLINMGSGYAISRYAKWESLPYSTALTATFPHGIRALIYQYFEAEPALQGLRGSSENLVIQDKLQEAFKADGLTAYEKTGIIQNVLHSNARLLNGPEGIFLLDKNRTRKILSLSRLHFLVRESKLESFEALQKLDSQYSDIRRLINDQELSGYQTTGRKIRNWKKRHLHSLIFLFPYSIRNAIARGCKQVCEGSTSLQRDLAANELALAHCGMKLMRQRSIDGRKSK